jgi:hypothetical protein
MAGQMEIDPIDTADRTKCSCADKQRLEGMAEERIIHTPERCYQMKIRLFDEYPLRGQPAPDAHHIFAVLTRDEYVDFVDAWVPMTYAPERCEQCIHDHMHTNSLWLGEQRVDKCLAHGCIVRCEDCGLLFLNRYTVGPCIMHHMDIIDACKFTAHFKKLTSDSFAPQYVYNVALGAAAHYARRREKYRTAIVQHRTLSDLADTITQYV